MEMANIKHGPTPSPINTEPHAEGLLDLSSYYLIDYVRSLSKITRQAKRMNR